MDSKIEKLVKKGILITGVLKRDEEGFVTVERFTDLEELKQREAQGEELYYATLSMGRSIFTINENGEIENYKGVDSCLTGDENVVVGLTDTRFIIIQNPVSGSMHEISLRTEPAQNGKRTCEFRFKGTSPLEDLEEEADKNADLNKIGVKVPKIKMVREYSIEKAKKLGLPYHIPGDYSDLEDATNASDVFESRRRKEKIAKNQSIFYIDEWQVVVSSAHPGGQEGRDNQISIIDNHSAFGRARVALKSFKTEQEAQNFFKYVKSIIKAS